MPITGPAIGTSVSRGPYLALGRVEHAGGDDQEEDHFEAGAVPIIEVGLGCPGQEAGDVVRHLRHGGRRTVGKGDSVVAEWRRHCDLMTWEKFVVVHACEHLEACRRLLIAGQDRVHIIRAARSGLDDQRLIRRKGAVIRGTRRLVVWERPRDRVEGPSGPLVHLAFVIWSVGDLIAGSDRLDLVLAVADLAEVAKIEMLDRMTDRANLLVNLEATLQRSP